MQQPFVQNDLKLELRTKKTESAPAPWVFVAFGSENFQSGRMDLPACVCLRVCMLACARVNELGLLQTE